MCIGTFRQSGRLQRFVSVVNLHTNGYTKRSRPVITCSSNFVAIIPSAQAVKLWNNIYNAPVHIATQSHSLVVVCMCGEKDIITLHVSYCHFTAAITYISRNRDNSWSNCHPCTTNNECGLSSTSYQSLIVDSVENQNKVVPIKKIA